MMNIKRLIIFSVLALTFLPSQISCRDYIIYNISQDIPMGFDNEVIKKNFYVNMGQNQGIGKGDVLDVFRNVSRLDPYASKRRYNYSVKIGELKVLHSEENSAITKLEKYLSQKDTPHFELKKFMIGDKVKVKIE